MFRFTIRDVLWLTVLVALGVGWWISQRDLQKENRRLRVILNGVLYRSPSMPNDVWAKPDSRP